MTMKIYVPGYSTIEGQPETVVRLMQQGRRFDSDEPMDKYIETVQRDIFRLYNLSTSVEGTTIRERSESLLRAMSSVGLIEILDE